MALDICGDDAVFLPESECDACEQFLSDVERIDAKLVEVDEALAGKQDTLVAGDNITLTDLGDGTTRIDAAGGSGEGIPTGGTTGQVLAKTSNADGAVAWRDSGALPAHTAALILVETTDWSAQTTQVSGVDYHTATKAVSKVNVPVPDICIGCAIAATLPTPAEQAAYDRVKYVTHEVDGTTNEPYLMLYATSVPDNDFYILAEGVEAV